MTDSLPAFTAPGRFWRGNLHTHSTRSDGVLAPEEVCRRYRAEGYDFLALTDHFVGRYGYPIVDTVPFRTNSFTTILGAELHSGAMANGELWHILAVGLPARFRPVAHPGFPAGGGAGNRAGDRGAGRCGRGLRRRRASAMVRPDAGGCPQHHGGPCGRDLQPRLRRRAATARRFCHRRPAADRRAARCR